MDLQTVHHIDFPPRLRLVKNDEIEAARVERMLEALADDSVERDTERARLAAIEADTRRDIRIMRWQSRVKWFAILTAYATVIYFCWQLGRGQ